MNAQPEDIPNLIDPLFNYLSHVLPWPIYSLVVKVISHSLTAFSAGMTLFQFLTSTDPTDWDLQTILPPLISLIAAYLALLSIYRTTTWMIRTVVWFIKWGLILGVLLAGASYVMGRGGPGSLANVGGLLLDAFAQQNRNIPNAARSATASRPRAGQSPPRSWDSFEQHQAWGAQNRGAQEQDEELRKVVQGIVSMTDKVLQDNGWWGVAKGIANEFGRDIPQTAGEEDDGGVSGTI
ncbi:hypothetical protein AX16_001875 [Volvariella volvacea WC 439]|nr:hypothetical protein AX16_001875 [Volvariella volvacea WC 439]